MSHERMLNKDVEPTERDIVMHLGARAAKRWSLLTEYLSAHYDHVPELDFGGQKYGWSIRYRKSGKTLVTLYPRRGGFTALVVLGKKEVAKAEALLGELSPTVAQVFRETSQLHDGRWLWIRPASKADVESIKMLLSTKRRPKLLMREKNAEQ